MMIRAIIAGSCLAVTSAAFAGSLSGTVTATGQSDSADAVVYVDAIAGKTFPAPAAHASVDQSKMTFVPRVLPILVGTTVDFNNSDNVNHNVFSPDKCADAFNLGSWGRGSTKSHTFGKPCVADLLCNVHSEMEGYVLALPTPYFAVTDKAGAYAIKDVPDGVYSVKVWHPRLKQALRKVTVKDATQEDFKLEK
jgi:plastocyanin